MYHIKDMYTDRSTQNLEFFTVIIIAAFKNRLLVKYTREKSSFFLNIIRYSCLFVCRTSPCYYFLNIFSSTFPLNFLLVIILQHILRTTCNLQVVKKKTGFIIT